MASFGVSCLGIAPEHLVGAAAVMIAVCIEFPRMLDLTASDIFMGCKRFFMYCTPEALGLAAIFSLAVFLRLCSDMHTPNDSVSVEIWEEIKTEWPILMGADTLLNFQSMLRVLIFTSAACRAGLLSGLIKCTFRQSSQQILGHQSTGQFRTVATAVASPLSGMGVALSLGSMLARARLCTQAEVYMPEGPLSLAGYLPLFCDYLSVLLLLTLAPSVLLRCTRTLVCTAAATTFATWLASRHYLNLAQDSNIDGLFTLTYILEFLAACAFFGRAVLNSGCDTQASQHGHTFMGFVHVLMAFQQALGAYYFLTAFEPSPKIVGAGRPCCVVIWTNLVALGAYLAAAGLYFGGLCAEGPQDGIGNGSGRAETIFSANSVISTAMSTSTTARAASATPSVRSINL